MFLAAPLVTSKCFCTTWQILETFYLICCANEGANYSVDRLQETVFGCVGSKHGVKLSFQVNLTN